MKLMKRLENMFAAVAFAEEGDAMTAVRIAEEGVRPENMKSEGTHGCEGCEGLSSTPAKA